MLASRCKGRHDTTMTHDDMLNFAARYDITPQQLAPAAQRHTVAAELAALLNRTEGGQPKDRTIVHVVIAEKAVEQLIIYGGGDTVRYVEQELASFVSEPETNEAAERQALETAIKQAVELIDELKERAVLKSGYIMGLADVLNLRQAAPSSGPSNRRAMWARATVEKLGEEMNQAKQVMKEQKLGSVFKQYEQIIANLSEQTTAMPSLSEASKVAYGPKEKVRQLDEKDQAAQYAQNLECISTVLRYTYLDDAA